MYRPYTCHALWYSAQLEWGEALGIINGFSFSWKDTFRTERTLKTYQLGKDGQADGYLKRLIPLPPLTTPRILRRHDTRQEPDDSYGTTGRLW